MKAPENITTRLIVCCVFALSLFTNIPAQAQTLPSATYHSAKDLDLPGLPFNPFPGAPIWEVDTGFYLVDDTGIPDMPGQAAARQKRENAARWADAIANDPVATQAAKEAQQAAQEADWQRNQEAITPWLHHDMRGPGGAPSDVAEQKAAEVSRLNALVQTLAIKDEEDQAAVAKYLADHGLSGVFGLVDGNITAIVGIENGIPRVQMECNVKAADTVGADELWPDGNTGLNLKGTNVVFGMWNGGNVREHADLDFYLPSGFRVTDMDGVGGFGISDHATHVTGTLIASGIATVDCTESEEFGPLTKGMGYQGRVLAYDFLFDATEMTGAAANGLHLSNHSYGLQAGWGVITNVSYWFGDIAISTDEDYHFGFYSTDVQTIDQIAQSAPAYLPVWAAANERSTNAGKGRPFTAPELGYETFANGIQVTSYAPRPDDGDSGGFDTLSQQASAKNVLTVGAVHPITNGYAGTASVVMSDFSSFGPTDDGRIKPDVVADGVNVFSLGGICNHVYMSGTSMAAPSVCGSLGLVLELHNRLHGTNQAMLASSMKGLAIHTADEAGGFPGPDYRFGWGLFNARKAALLVQSNYASGSLAHIKEVRLTGGDNIEFPVVSDGAQPLTVTIQWNDPPGTPPAASLDPTNLILVNDLDLRVISPSGTTNSPWVLDPVARTNAATLGDNFRDNVEQVVITNTTAGTYLIRITHKGANLVTGISGATNEQWVSTLISGNTPQTAPPLQITSITVVSSNSVALMWPSVVGRLYQVQHRDDVASGSWSNSAGEISATKTNVAVTLSMAGNVTNRFYRVAQLR